MKRGWFEPYLKKPDCFAKRLGLIFISVPQRCLVAGRITEQLKLGQYFLCLVAVAKEQYLSFLGIF